MAGLNQEPVAQSPVGEIAMPVDQGQPGQPSMQAGGDQSASPEEQDIYNRVVSLAMLALYDEKAMPEIVNLLKASDDPATEVGNVVANIAMKVFTFAKESGTVVPGEVMMHAGAEITEQVAEVAERVGVPIDEAALEQSFYAALDAYRVMAQEQGDYSDETVQQDMAGLKQMDQDGTIDRLMQSVGQAQQEEAV